MLNSYDGKTQLDGHIRMVEKFRKQQGVPVAQNPILLGRWVGIGKKA